MQVTKDKFEKLMPEIEAAIASSDFLSYDLEFSAYLSMRNPFTLEADDIYKMFARASNAPQILQFGLCCFKVIPGTIPKLECTPISFPTMPYEPHSFSFLSSSIQFLKKSGFDFNKWITDAIPYMTVPERERAFRAQAEKEKLASAETERDAKHKRAAYGDTIKHCVDEILRAFEDNFRTTIVEYEGPREYNDQQKHKPLRAVKLTNLFYNPKLHDIFHKYALSDATQILHEKYKTADFGLLLRVEDNNSKNRKGLILELYPSEAIANGVSARRVRLMRPEHLCGFQRVLDLFKKYKKPLVLFSGLQDLFLAFREYVFGYEQNMLAKEIKPGIPSNATEFADIVHEYFPVVIDLKAIFNSDEGRLLTRGKQTSLTNVDGQYVATLVDAYPSGGSLEVLYKFLTRPTKTLAGMKTTHYNKNDSFGGPLDISIVNGSGKDENCVENTLTSLHAHDAAYDAYMTGVAFIMLCNRTFLNYKMKMPLLLDQLYLFRSVTFYNLSNPYLSGASKTLPESYNCIINILNKLTNGNALTCFDYDKYICSLLPCWSLVVFTSARGEKQVECTDKLFEKVASPFIEYLKFYGYKYVSLPHGSICFIRVLPKEKANTSPKNKGSTVPTALPQTWLTERDMRMLFPGLPNEILAGVEKDKFRLITIAQLREEEKSMLE